MKVLNLMDEKMDKPVIILSGGGHAKVLLDILNLRGYKVLGFVDPDPDRNLPGLQYLGDDSCVMQYHPSDIWLVNGIGSQHNSNLRKSRFNYFQQHHFRFKSLVHPTAIISIDVQLGEGAQIMAGAILQPGVQIGINSIINTKASIDHDSIVGSHTHISPGVTICGNVVIGADSYIGASATIIQGIQIGTSVTVGAGSLVIQSYSSNTVIYGVPAKEAKNHTSKGE